MHEQAIGRCAAALIACVTAATAGAAPEAVDTVPPLGSYAYAWRISPVGPADFYEFELPLEVYRAVADPALRDLGIYDAAGEPVPRLVSAPANPGEAADELVVLAPLPVRAPSGTTVSEMSFALEQSGDRTSVRIEGGVPAADAGPLALVAYLVDLGESTDRLRALEFAWPAEVEPLITTVTIEGSPDLDQWTMIGSGTIAGLRQDESKIEQRRLAVAAREMRYLRLSWGAVPDGWQLTGLTALYSQAAAEPERNWLALTPAGRDESDGGYLYDAGGALMVDRLRLTLPAENSLVRAGIYCWLAREARWQRVHNGLFYRLRRDGSALASEPAAFERQRAARWKVVIERGDAESSPGLELGWRPDRVLFIAQGAGPWRLVAGSARDVENDFPQARLYSDPGMRSLLDEAGPAGAVTLGAREVLGGAPSLAPSRGPEWRRWILWIGLVAGVLLVGGMAWRLSRSAPG